jgi:hypothetical protein
MEGCELRVEIRDYRSLKDDMRKSIERWLWREEAPMRVLDASAWTWFIIA